MEKELLILKRKKAKQSKRIPQKIRAEYKKYLVKFKRDKKKADKEEKAFLKFDKEMTAREKAIEKENKETEED